MDIDVDDYVKVKATSGCVGCIGDGDAAICWDLPNCNLVDGAVIFKRKQECDTEDAADYPGEGYNGGIN